VADIEFGDITSERLLRANSFKALTGSRIRNFPEL
jgi:hypothetical protein